MDLAITFGQLNPAVWELVAPWRRSREAVDGLRALAEMAWA